jgi:hypothetical protein
MAANAAFDALRELLARRPEPLPGEALVPSGIAALDEALAGGFPRGSIVTLEGAPSSGCSALLARLCARATAEGLGALIQSEGRLSAEGLAAAGVRLERLVIVPVEDALGIVRGADILVRAGTFAVVAIPMPRPVRGIGAAVWNRLAALAQRTGTLLVVTGIDPPPELSAAAAVRVGLGIAKVRFRGPAGLFGELAGYDVAACIHKHRRSTPGGRATIQCEPFEPRPKGGAELEHDRSRDFGFGAPA